MCVCDAKKHCLLSSISRLRVQIINTRNRVAANGQLQLAMSISRSCSAMIVYIASSLYEYNRDIQATFCPTNADIAVDHVPKKRRLQTPVREER